MDTVEDLALLVGGLFDWTCGRVGGRVDWTWLVVVSGLAKKSVGEDSFSFGSSRLLPADSGRLAPSLDERPGVLFPSTLPADSGRLVLVLP